MLKPKPQPPRREENVIPLINVVFLMLIFFLITTSIRPFNKDVIKLPTAQELEKSRIRGDVVLVGAEGQITVFGQPASLETLAETLTPWAKRATKDKPMPIVADRELSADVLVSVLEAANKAGVKHMKLVTERSER